MYLFEIKTTTFYHVTPTKNIRSILKNGLTTSTGPRSKKLNDNGIFLFNDLDTLEDAVTNWLGDEFKEDESLSILKVSLPSDFKVTQTPNAEYEFSTMKPIPASAIQVYKQNI